MDFVLVLILVVVVVLVVARRYCDCRGCLYVATIIVVATYVIFGGFMRCIVLMVHSHCFRDFCICCKFVVVSFSMVAAVFCGRHGSCSFRLAVDFRLCNA